MELYVRLSKVSRLILWKGPLTAALAGYGTPWKATLLLSFDCRALSIGGPATEPILPGSLVPRAKMTVTSLQGASLVTSLAVLDAPPGIVLPPPVLPPPVPPPPPTGKEGKPPEPPNWGRADAVTARKRESVPDAFIVIEMGWKKSKYNLILELKSSSYMRKECAELVNEENCLMMEERNEREWVYITFWLDSNGRQYCFEPCSVASRKAIHHTHENAGTEDVLAVDYWIYRVTGVHLAQSDPSRSIVPMLVNLEYRHSARLRPAARTTSVKAQAVK